jgi:hypothetical protein
MLSSEIATLRAQAAALLSKAAALESALNALARVAEAPVAEAPVAVAPVAEAPVAVAPVAEAVAPKVKKPAHSWALFFKRVCAILKEAGYTGSLISVQPLWHQSHEWADADIVPAWLAFKAQAEAVAAAGGGATAAEAAPAEPKPKKQMTPEQREAAREKRKAYRAAKALLRPSYLEGMNCLTNDRGDVVSVDGEWLGHWTGHAIDFDAPIPADFDELKVAD